MANAEVEKDESTTKVLTPEFRVSFPNVFKPRVNKEKPGEPGKYTISMLFRIEADPTKPEEKVVDIRPLVAAATAAAVEKYGADKTKWPKGLKFPFRKAEEKEGLDGYVKGLIVVGATSERQPGVVDQQVKDIIDPKLFYPGCFARAVINAFAYDNSGNKGISFGLRHVQKIRDGKMLGGSSKPEDDFTPIDTPAAPAGAGIEDIGIPGL